MGRADRRKQSEKRKSSLWLNVLLYVSLAVFLVCAVVLGSYLYDTIQNSNRVEEIKTLVRPEEGAQRDIAAILAVAPDYKGWLTVEGTNIDYPVVQGKDNDYYLDHSFDGQQTRFGALFIDKDYVAGESSNRTIYAHNLKNGQGFATLLKYRDQSFYQQYPSFVYEDLEGEQTTYDVIAAFHVDLTQPDYFVYNLPMDFSNAAQRESYVSQLKRHARYDTGFTLSEGDEIITLSTCSYNTDDERFVVVGKRRVTQ